MSIGLIIAAFVMIVTYVILEKDGRLARTWAYAIPIFISQMIMVTEMYLVEGDLGAFAALGVLMGACGYGLILAFFDYGYLTFFCRRDDALSLIRQGLMGIGVAGAAAIVMIEIYALLSLVWFGAF